MKKLHIFTREEAENPVTPGAAAVMDLGGALKSLGT